MLKMEKQLCDYLIVALQVDPTIDRPGSKNKPCQSVYERYVQLQACKYVDEILVYETEYDLLQVLMTQKIDIRFLSEEYLNRDYVKTRNRVRDVKNRLRRRLGIANPPEVLVELICTYNDLRRLIDEKCK